MKSLVEEASSITKAIEKAWTRAGKPQSFSVKIFENPEVGFLGFTKKSAKVGIFFEEIVAEKTPRNHHNKPAQTQERTQDSNNRPHREYTPRQDREPRQERRQDSRQRGPRQHARPNNRPQQDNQHPRENRQSNPRHRDQDSSAPRPQRHQGHTHERHERSERVERPQQHREAAQERVHETPVQQNQTAAKPLDVTIPVTSAANIKRAPKISGRRFVAPKKDDESNNKS